MRYPCPQCGRAYVLQHWQVGQEFECPNCHTHFVVESLSGWTMEDGHAPAQQVVTQSTEPSPFRLEHSPGPSAGASPSPDHCPECGRVLYPVPRLRPTPSLGWPARLVLVAGIVLSVVVYWAGLLGIRSVVWMPLWVVSLLWFPVALLPALGCGLLASRFPRVIRRRCRGYGWQSRAVLGR